MKILLAGGAGYIGTHTIIELIKSKHQVLVADNFSNSKPEALKRVEKIIGEKIPFYRCDVTNEAALEKVFSENEIDVVIHFAGAKAVGESIEQPLKYYRNNLDSTLSLLEVMKKYAVNHFIFSSSATVYGIPDKMPLTEDMPTGCTNPYGFTKLMNEQILRDAVVANKDLSVVLLRYFNPIGAHESGKIGEDPNGIPNNLLPYISQVGVGKLKSLCVFGNDYPTKDGTGVRDYIHVVDLAKGHVAALDYARDHLGIEVFNLGTGVGYSVLEMIQAFEEVNQIKIPYSIVKRRPGDIASCYADPQKAGKALCWKAEKTLEEMCRDTWHWQTQNPQGYSE